MKWIIACAACVSVGFLCGAGPYKYVSYTYYTRTASVDLSAIEARTAFTGGDEVVGASLVQTKSGPVWAVLFRIPKADAKE